MLPIEDYAIIGDCRAAALVSRTASIDWLCWPRFDSAPLFGAILDEGGGALDEALRTFQRLCGHANDVGLFAEEIDPATGRADPVVRDRGAPPLRGDPGRVLRRRERAVSALAPPGAEGGAASALGPRPVPERRQ